MIVADRIDSKQSVHRRPRRLSAPSSSSPLPLSACTFAIVSDPAPFPAFSRSDPTAPATPMPKAHQQPAPASHRDFHHHFPCTYRISVHVPFPCQRASPPHRLSQSVKNRCHKLRAQNNGQNSQVDLGSPEHISSCLRPLNAQKALRERWISTTAPACVELHEGC